MDGSKDESKDKSKVSAWLGQSSWKGGFVSTKHEMEDEEKIVIKPVEWASKDTNNTFESDISLSLSKSQSLPRSTSGPMRKFKSIAGGLGSGSEIIPDPTSHSGRRKTRVSGKSAHKIRHPKHHLHLHVHAEVMLDELPYLYRSSFMFIRSLMDAEEELPHFIGTSPYSRYQVWDRSRKQLYTGIELGKFIIQFLLGPSRPFTLKLYDPDGVHKYTIRRSCNCWLLFVGGHYFGNGAVVHDAQGKLIGSVTQRWCYLKPTYDIRDAEGTSILFAQGTTQNPIHVMFQRIHFNLFTTENYDNVGLLTRHHWQQVFYRFKRETEEGASFGVGYPKDLDGVMKIQILAAAFLLNISYFEHKTGGLSVIDIIFYLLLTTCAFYIIKYHCLEAFYDIEYIPWCQRHNNASCITKNTSTPSPKLKP